ncbi:E3 ubiquitin-protein ligase ATL15 [Hordeum vulgare]|nr:E3 ubiquitin-protein ligase ATL15 [Hordeum vulgare]
MPPVEFIIGLGFYATALGCCAFSCRLVYVVYCIISTRFKNRDNLSSSSSSSSSDDDGSNLYSEADEHSTCYDEEQGAVIPICNEEEQGVIPNCDDVEQGLISEGESDGTGTSTTGGDRCCICLEQMTDAGGMWRRLRVALCMEQTAQDPEDKRRRRLPRCGHVFHAGCIDEWLKRSLTCPSCRRTAVPGGLLDDPDVLLRIIILCYFFNYCLSY